MPVFLVEDGTGVEDATSYVDLAYADDYLGASWAPDDASKEAALMAATEYADVRWGAKLMGGLKVRGQGLLFPRRYIYDSFGYAVEGVPNDWKKAISLYAKESHAGTLYPQPQTGNAKEVKRKRTTVGPITTELEYTGAVESTAPLKFPLADGLVRKFTYLSNSRGKVIRN